MQTVALKPKRAEWTAMFVGLLILCAGMLIVPAMCVPFALAAPLLACPLVGRKEEPLAWASALMPTIASLLAGYDALYAASLALVGLLPLLITRFVPLKQRPGAKGMLMYISAMALALTIVLAAATRMLGGALQYSLAQAFVNWVGNAPNRQNLLQQFAVRGLLSIPEGYLDQGVTRPLMEAAYQQQMLMSLRLTIENLLAQYLPALFVESCLITGLFISLRLERVNGILLVVETRTASDKRTRVVAPPSFRLLAMPLPVRLTAFALALTALVVMMESTGVVLVVGQLCYAAFQTLFRLLGAAVVVFMYTRNDPDRKMMAGILATALYIMAPFVLLLIGLADQRFHFRKPQAQKPDEHKEEEP